MGQLHFHEVIRPTISQSFFEKTLDLWLRRAEGHIGPDMYQHHEGVCGSSVMSGVTTWAQYEKCGTLPHAGKQLFLESIQDVAATVGYGYPIVEFGPGAMEDAQTLINVTQAREYIPVDCSVEILRHAKKLVSFTKSCVIRPAVVDFLSSSNSPLIDEPCLGVLLGLTVGNLDGAVPTAFPKKGVIQSLTNVTRAMPCGGHLLVSIDACQDGALNQQRYLEETHRVFSLNHLYRMECELPLSGFDPSAFEYEPIWYAHCGLLAHTIKATESQTFEMGLNGEHKVEIKRGDVFHCDNSYKFPKAFFESCVIEAGMAVKKVWQGASSLELYLLEVPPAL